MKDIGIIICNFNKKEYLNDCVNSVLKNDIDKESYDIIIVDNASTDGAPEMVKSEFSREIILLENKENLGGSGGFARGINYCLENNYEYLVLLDNDTKIEANTIQNLKKHIDENPDVGVVGAKILQMDHPDILQDLGALIDWEYFNIKVPYKGHRNTASLPNVVECDYVAACCFITKREVVKKAGNFDIRHFIYWDDMDWCIRVKNAGYKVQAISNATVYHKMGANNTINTFNSYYFTKNRIFFFLKHLPENKIPKFVESIANDFINLSFFSSIKGQSNNALSQFLAVEDLCNGKFGRVDEHIFDKEKVGVFEQKNINKASKILLIINDDMESSSQVYFILKNYFSKLLIFDRDNIFNDYSDVNFIDYNSCQAEAFDYAFVVEKHIMDAELSKPMFENQLVIDKYQNVEFLKDLKILQNSYKSYKKIFQNINKPILYEKMMMIRDSLN